jgi:hypothetical protein
MNQQGFGAPGVAAGGGAGGPVGQTRNPVMVLLISMICFIYYLLSMFKMVEELQNYTGGGPNAFPGWHLLIPYYNLYLMFVKMPKWVTEAKTKAGCSNPNSMGGFMYFLIAPYALAADLNQVWNPRGLPA